MKHFNNNTNDDIYDDKIGGKISGIRMILSRLGNTVTNNDRKNITKELYEIEKKENLSDEEKERIYDDLVKLVETLDKKEEYKYHDHDDLNYYGIRDIFHLLIMMIMMIITNHYQLNFLLKIIINIMKAEEIKTKNYQ